MPHHHTQLPRKHLPALMGRLTCVIGKKKKKWMEPELRILFIDTWDIALHPYFCSHFYVSVFPGHLSLAKTHPSPALIQPPCSLLLPKPYYSDFLAYFSQLFSILRIFLELSLLSHFAITEAVTELDCSRSPYFPLASGGASLVLSVGLIYFLDRKWW